MRNRAVLYRVRNAFCPTGKGGGVDPTCSPHTSGKVIPERPPAIIGQGRLQTDAICDYIDKYGTECKAGRLPGDVLPGKPNLCYDNATQLAIRDPKRFQYTEGIAYTPTIPGLAFLHAWGTDTKTGKVVDPTWKEPEKCTYYGVKYNNKQYIKYIMKTGYYGVLGGSNEDAPRVLRDGTLK